MGQKYEQLSLEERCAIARLHEDGQSIRQIAASLGRSASTISRELKRNSGNKVGYKPAWADDQAWSRRWRGSRLARQSCLREFVLRHLAMGWSPEQISGRLALEKGCTVISHESIYRFIYAQIRRTNDFSWRLFLPRGKSVRGRRRRIPKMPWINKNRVSIALRPACINQRIEPGHWEADLLLPRQTGASVLVAHERASRFTFLAKQPDKQALPLVNQIKSWFSLLPPHLRRSLTQDNGSEFSQHQRLHSLGVHTYFCDPYSPWQKGSIENMNGRIRRFIPAGTDARSFSNNDLQALAFSLNHTPRKCLGFKTPAEVFSAHLLHFKCESTKANFPG